MPTNAVITNVWPSSSIFDNIEESSTAEDEEVVLVTNGETWASFNSSHNPSPPPPPSVSTIIEAPVVPTLDSDDIGYIETASDYHVKYGNCYGILNNKLLKVTDFYNSDEGDNTPIMNYKLLKSEMWIPKSDGPEVIEEVDWTLPYLGAINIFNTVLFIRRRHKQNSPTRYRKGFRLDIMNIYYPSRKEFNMMGKECHIETTSDENEVLKSIFFPNRFKVEEALDSVLSLDRLGAAFSDNYYFTLSNSVNNIVLWRGSNIIGIWNKGFKGFDLTTSLFTNDLDNLGIKWEAA